MNKRSLGVLAVILIFLMAVVAMAGLDNLPRGVKSSISAAATRVETDRSEFDQARAAISRTLAADPELFRTQVALWQSRLASADEKLKRAEAELQDLRTLEKANRRQDAGKATEELKQIEGLRSGAVQEAKSIRAEAERWAGYKRNLPAQIAAMRSSYEGLHAFDTAAQAKAARQAMLDWPQKKDDLQARLNSIEQLRKEGQQAWESTVASRTKAEAKDFAGVDYAALFTAGETVERDLREMQRGAEAANTLAAQLYVNRDKLLLDLDDDNGGKQKVRVVETKYTDSTLKNSSTASKEEWENIDSGRVRDLQKSIGMVVERKPAGKYDSEAERNVQPPAYAYIAPPGQANQYGSWQNGVWTWLPQYLIMSQLLRSVTVPPISSGDYYDYDRARRRGDTWYGRSGEYRSTWNRNSGTASQGGWRGMLDRLRNGTSSQGGGTISSGSTRPRESWNTGGSTFGGSKYQSRGTFGGSRYQSRPSGGSGWGGGFGSRSYSRGTFSRGFGRGGRR